MNHITLYFTGDTSATVTEGDTLRLGSVHTYEIVAIDTEGGGRRHSLTLCETRLGHIQTLSLPAGTRINGCQVAADAEPLDSDGGPTGCRSCGAQSAEAPYGWCRTPDAHNNLPAYRPDHRPRKGTRP